MPQRGPAKPCSWLSPSAPPRWLPGHRPHTPPSLAEALLTARAWPLPRHTHEQAHVHRARPGFSLRGWAQRTQGPRPPRHQACFPTPGQAPVPPATRSVGWAGPGRQGSLHAWVLTQPAAGQLPGTAWGPAACSAQPVLRARGGGRFWKAGQGLSNPESHLPFRLPAWDTGRSQEALSPTGAHPDGVWP